jgi:hypothetical protein
MLPADFFGFLRTSLSRLAAEVPDAHRALAGAMGNLRARLVADGVARTIRFDFSDWTIYAEDSDVDLEVSFDREIIVDLIDGNLTMEDAIYRERLRMRGPIERIERFYDALLIYLEALTRTSGAPAMLQSYRQAQGSVHSGEPHQRGRGEE